MIRFPGFDELIRTVHENGQAHVFEYWEELSSEEKKALLQDLADIDFDQLGRLFPPKTIVHDTDFRPAPYVSLPHTDKERKEFSSAAASGALHIREGKVAVFMAAGGQGSRLGYEGPKGMFRIGPVSNNPLFQIHAEKVLKYSRKFDSRIPFIIMTSRANYKETAEFFKENGFFGLPSEDVFMFYQQMVPSLDAEGKLILESRNRIFKNPDGHGGSLTALQSSGILAEIKRRGIETLSYFQVDNPLANIVDPVFIGFHLVHRAEVSSKAVKKTYPEEKVGVFVRFGSGRIGIVEYSDFPQDRLLHRNGDGNLMYSSGNIAVHLFNSEFIERVASGHESALPYHAANKRIRTIREGAVSEIDGYKFEKFIFDALPLAERSIVFEVSREDEFAPVKNATGIDSVESAQKLMLDLHRKWLTMRGIRVPASARIIEISPLAAVGPEDLDADLVLPEEEKL